MYDDYPSYSTIKQKWVDTIPSHWNVKRLKAILRCAKSETILS